MNIWKNDRIPVSKNNKEELVSNIRKIMYKGNTYTVLNKYEKLGEMHAGKKTPQRNNKHLPKKIMPPYLMNWAMKFTQR